jgi:hypothetical protein
MDMYSVFKLCINLDRLKIDFDGFLPFSSLLTSPESLRYGLIFSLAVLGFSYILDEKLV